MGPDIRSKKKSGGDIIGYHRRGFCVHDMCPPTRDMNRFHHDMNLTSRDMRSFKRRMNPFRRDMKCFKHRMNLFQRDMK